MKLRGLIVKETATSPMTKAEKRVSTLPTPDIAPWAESCLYAIGRSLHDWGRDPTQAMMLDEAVVAAETLQVLLVELRRRVT